MTGLPNSRAGRTRRGMALPMVIVVLLVLGASFAGGVALARGERALDDAGKTAVDAQTWAETGLQRVLADRPALGLVGAPGAYDSTRVTISSGGYYDVTTTQLRVPVGTTVSGLYYLRAHAVITKASIAGAPSAEYWVSKLAKWTAGHMAVQGALTGLNGINWNGGGNGSISGTDACATGPAVPGIAVPQNPGIVGTGNHWQDQIAGSPPIDTTSMPHQITDSITARNASPINWPDIVRNNSITPDYTVNCSGSSCDTSTLPTAAWFTANPTANPVIRVNNRNAPGGGTSFPAFTMPSGRGTLVITGDLTMSGSATWDGIVLTGGRITSNGSTTINGVAVSGLNAQLGDQNVMSNDLDQLNGTKHFLYNSCSVQSATASLGHMTVYKNSWSNSCKTY